MSELFPFFLDLLLKYTRSSKNNSYILFETTLRFTQMKILN